MKRFDILIRTSFEKLCIHIAFLLCDAMTKLVPIYAGFADDPAKLLKIDIDLGFLLVVIVYLKIRKLSTYVVKSVNWNCQLRLTLFTATT